MADVEKDRFAEGWQPDPFGRHEQRWMSVGTATDLVRDGRSESRDPPVAAPSCEPEPPLKQHWIDVDGLERLRHESRQPLPWPLTRSRPPYPVPGWSRWRFGLAMTLSCITVFTTLAFHFGHVLNPPPPLGRNETIGQVNFVFGSTYMVYYEAPGHPDVNGTPAGIAGGYASPGTVAPDQSVIVRYDPKNTTNGTVVALTPPQSTPNGTFGWIVVSTSFVVSLLAWGYYAASRTHRAVRRRLEEEDNIDYRDDEWAGTTNSA